MLPENVLVVEDDATLRNLVVVLLERVGCRVETACDGNEALQKLGTGIDLVLLDLMMPRRSGAEVLQEVAASRSDLLARIVVMTAALDQEANDAVGTASIRGMLRKPFNNEDLMAAIA